MWLRDGPDEFATETISAEHTDLPIGNGRTASSAADLHEQALGHRLPCGRVAQVFLLSPFAQYYDDADAGTGVSQSRRRPRCRPRP
jgi:hypothetical protein